MESGWARHHDPDAAAFFVAAEEHKLAEERRRIQLRHARLYAAGRIVLAAVFVAAGLGKLVRYEPTLTTLRAGGLFDAELLLPFAVGIELIGGAMLALGIWARAAALGLIVYLGAVVLLLPRELADWSVLGVNAALAGALLLIVGHGAGRWSVEHGSHRHGPPAPPTLQERAP